MNLLRLIAGQPTAASVKELGKPTMSLFEPDVTTKKATFGMSWFWFPEAQFGCAKGVIRTRVGYAGGSKKNPTYYSLGDHTETIDVDYDPNVTNYEEMLHMFWNNHNPTVKCKRQYMSAIFYHDEEQKSLAEKTMKEMKPEFKAPISTLILPAEEFYDAEDYHQKYMLQHHPWLLEACGINPGDHLIKSHVAARLNGYIGGYGTPSKLQEEASKLGINDKMTEYVMKQMKARHWNHQRRYNYIIFIMEENHYYVSKNGRGFCFEFEKIWWSWSKMRYSLNDQDLMRRIIQKITRLFFDHFNSLGHLHWKYILLF